jgi:hypothetical protein
MMFELTAAAVVAVFVSCLYSIVRGFFRDLEEIGNRRLVTARRFGQQESRQQKAQRRPGGI